ncbi:MAG: 23S rRNA (guanosine(2251)-2'-O)-methyltransferase RlmB [Anaerovibrio sp.]|uniref:23S rRNA (guanosine(2251)-2'-O)-methyltransferase RlmB n=1 Tax=uncultured Anaerovibrio sp. TaxID=361586 RepID=UPI0025E5F798|nr:23S rRNA (guanosine(2251)-2'-O)-methyltransferase RlmB [uncultured Anaerovibrio sp.]MBQ3853220.1 23S rRNA (guanosine(2251)-2'-O)-methyltransferase RlmB [Anaerovibrio sp.]
MGELPEDIVAGRNAVMEALKGNRSINKLLVANGNNEGSIKEIIAVAKEQHINIQFVERSKLDNLVRGIRHQGVLAQVAPVEYVELEDILQIAKDKNEPPFIVLLDELEDPHNLGAILRSADAAGVHGVLIPKRRSCPLSATVAKTSAGAVEYVPVARIGNVVQTIKRLKEEGLWVAAADMDGTDYYEADMTGALLLIIGNEGHGVGRLVKEQCDFVVKIPMVGKINSLNASVAGSILMYEAMKQRRNK